MMSDIDFISGFDLIIFYVGDCSYGGCDVDAFLFVNDSRPDPDGSIN